jgi:hypothetical protein
MKTVVNTIAKMALAITFLAMPALADAVFTPGNNPQPNEENILFTSGGHGTTLNAFTNQTHTNVVITSTTNTLLEKGGQSDLSNFGEGLLHDVNVSTPGFTFTDFILNPFKPKVSGDLVVSVMTNDGLFLHTYGSKNGDNFLTVTTKNNEVIEWVQVDSASGFQGLKQPRISGLEAVATPTPEPSTMLLLGSGLIGLAGWARRKIASN